MRDAVTTGSAALAGVALGAVAQALGGRDAEQEGLGLEMRLEQRLRLRLPALGGAARGVGSTGRPAPGAGWGRAQSNQRVAHSPDEVSRAGIAHEGRTRVTAGSARPGSWRDVVRAAGLGRYIRSL
jgi:hypothetical protein